MMIEKIPFLINISKNLKMNSPSYKSEKNRTKFITGTSFSVFLENKILQYDNQFVITQIYYYMNYLMIFSSIIFLVVVIQICKFRLFFISNLYLNAHESRNTKSLFSTSGKQQIIYVCLCGTVILIFPIASVSQCTEVVVDNGS